MVFWFSGSLWVRGYPIAEKAKEETLSSTVYRYRDAYEPFLYKFLFTMTGRLVMYTVMLYLFPCIPTSQWTQFYLP